MIKSKRLASIDILRALTMLLMIFVNDLWSLSGIPDWLGHAGAAEDRMGLADVVFPAFMFIIGLSIPHALKARLKKGEDKQQVLIHIVTRSFAMIVMGLFMVNLESLDVEASILSKEYWQLLMFFSFMMIWNNYQNPKVFGLVPPVVMKIAGWGILVFLAFIYKGIGDTWMLIHWWGILGLLGWSYLVCAIIYLGVGDKMLGVGIVVLVLLLLNVSEFVEGLDFKLVISASNHVSVMLGVFTTVIFGQLRELNKAKEGLIVLGVFAIVLILFGVITRPEWGISKIRATPSWTTICAGISLLSFLLLYLIADIKSWTGWAQPIAAGGYATLTCYLMPYFIYAIMDLLHVELPLILTCGLLGLLKSLILSYLIIKSAQWLGKLDVRLKI
ncbi:MAG: DUF5009 domain-containing protein [Reichenbachiella sp.]